MKYYLSIFLVMILSACGGTVQKKSAASQFSFQILQKHKGKCFVDEKMSLKAAVNASSACLSQNKLSDLHELSKLLRRLDESSPWGYYFDAHYFYEKRQYQQALWYSKKALERDYKNPILHYQLGRLYHRLEDISLAMYHFKEVDKLNPNIDQNHYILASLYMQNHNFQPALHHYTKISSSKIKKGEAKNIYLAAFSLEKYEIAMDYLQDIRKSEYSNQMHLDLAFMYQKVGKIDKALDTYKYVLKQNKWQNTTYTKAQISDKIKELQVQKRSVANSKAGEGNKN